MSDPALRVGGDPGRGGRPSLGQDLLDLSAERVAEVVAGGERLGCPVRVSAHPGEKLAILPSALGLLALRLDLGVVKRATRAAFQNVSQRAEFIVPGRLVLPA